MKKKEKLKYQTEEFFTFEFTVQNRIFLFNVDGFLKPETVGVPIPSDHFHLEFSLACLMMSED